MLLHLTVTLFCVGYVVSSSGSNANYFCADMQSQNAIDIEQLMGMWYGIEVISHKHDEEHTTVFFDTCPVIHLSEIFYPTTIDPDTVNYNMGMSVESTYGTGYGYGSYYPGATRSPQQQDPYYNQDYYGRPSSSYGHTTFSPRGYGYNRDRYAGHGSQQGVVRKYDSNNGNRRIKESELWKRLRLLWDEGGENVEYLVRYNITRAGFWISSGPNNGSELEPKYNQFAGTIQVMKAVGNHLVLTFCHQLPDRQLFTVLLSREPRLSRPEIHSVHNLLIRRGLSTNHIKKVCASSGGSTIFKNMWYILTVTIFLMLDLLFNSIRA